MNILLIVKRGYSMIRVIINKFKKEAKDGNPILIADCGPCGLFFDYCLHTSWRKTTAVERGQDAFMLRVTSSWPQC
jgi:hypothetical protein